MEIPAELKTKLAEALETFKEVLAEHAKAAVKELAAVSVAAANEGVKVIEKVSEVGLQLAEGKVDQKSAEMAMSNYMEAMRLLGLSVTNTAQVQAYKRALKLLETVKTVGFSLLQLAINIAVPAAGSFLNGLTAGLGKRG